MTYTLWCVHADQRARVQALRRAIADIAGEGVVDVRDGFAHGTVDGPHVVVYFGSPAGARSPDCTEAVARALTGRLLVLPVVTDLAEFAAEAPVKLRPFNGVPWGPQPAAPPALVHLVLEHLGLEERQRRVFISHRRSDALDMAEQIHDHLAKRRFEPFIDRFDIEPGEDVQRRIEESLSDAAFVLFLDSPEAHTSKWVIEEIHYALLHSLGVLVLRFPGVPPLEGTIDLPAIVLAEDSSVDPRRTLSDGELDHLAEQVEKIHAESLVRQRTRLVTHTTEVAIRAGFDVREQPGRFLLLYGPTTAGPRGAAPHAVVTVTPRPPQPNDLFALDGLREIHANPAADAILVHPEVKLADHRAEFLSWCVGDRRMSVVPDAAVDATWPSAPSI